MGHEKWNTFKDALCSKPFQKICGFSFSMYRSYITNFHEFSLRAQIAHLTVQVSTENQSLTLKVKTENK